MAEIPKVDEVGPSVALSMATIDLSQLLDYIKASGFQIGLPSNFGSSRNLEKKRKIL
ncbi:MAG: hypothetical protein H0U23_03040 [Blastocatellia bacterium]|nr:hypothetical protein [Blastocatellia bacterium]